MIFKSDPNKKESVTDVSCQSTNQDSKKQILKSTGIVGGAQIITILISIVRTKFIAILLGPSGVGIAGLFYSTLEMVTNLTSLGLGFSAVRDVAEANSKDDKKSMARTVTTVRRWMWITGVLGVALLIGFSRQLSFYTFKDYNHVTDFIMLSVIPLLSSLSSGQLVLLRGVRKIGDMAQAGILGAIFGLFITVPLYWMWGVKGIVPAMVLSAIANLCLSWWFARRLKIDSVHVGIKETVFGGAGMIKLGFFTVISGLAMSGTMYLVRIIIARRMGLDDLGQFQAALGLSATYLGLVLGAMAADYYPRLVTVNKDNSQIRLLVNEQTEVALLLAGPLVVGMLGFVDIVVVIFYSNKFYECSSTLSWMLVGELLKIVSWPIGFVFLAKSKGLIFIVCELTWDILFLGLIYFTLEKENAGIEKAGLAFFLSYIVYVVVIYFMCNRTSDFRWTVKTIKLIFFFAGLCALTFVNTRYMSVPLWRIVNLLLLVIAVVFSYKELEKIMNPKQLLEKIFKKLGLLRKTKDRS